MNKLFKMFWAVVIACTAVITLVGCEITTSQIEKFTVSVVEGTGAGIYEKGATATVTANNKGEDYDFLGWFEGEVKLNEKTVYSFEVTKDIVLTARFEHNPYKNLSENEKNDYINDQNLGFANRYVEENHNYWDGWTTTVEYDTTVKSPISSDKAAKITLAAMKNAVDEPINDAAAGCIGVGGAWSTIDMGLFGKTVKVLDYNYLEFDIKFDNAQPWFSVRFVDKDGKLSSELGFDIPNNGTNKKMISTDGWYHVIVDLDSKYNYTVLKGEDTIEGELLDNYNVLNSALKLRVAVSNSQSDWEKDSIIYLDNVKLTNTPFDASELENAVKEEMAELLAEEKDGTNKMTVAWNPDNFTFDKGEAYAKGDGSTKGVQIVYPAREGDDTWPRIQLHLNQQIDFTSNNVTIDVKPVSNHPWIEVHYYDSSWAEVMKDGHDARQAFDLVAGEWNTITLNCNCDNVMLLTIFVTSKGTNVANELWFDNLTVTPKPETHPEATLYNGDNISFKTKALRSEFAQYEKGISFEFKMTEGVTKMAFMDGPHSWANYTGNITFTRTGDTVVCDKGIVEAVGNGWYKAYIPYINFAGDGEEKIADTDGIDMIYYGNKADLTAESVYVDLDSLQVCDIESHPNKMEYKNNAGFEITKLAKADFANVNKGVYFEFSMLEGSFTTALMDGAHGWANYTSNIVFTRSGATVTAVLSGTNLVVEHLGGDWYSVVVPYAAFKGDGDQNHPENDGIDLLYGPVNCEKVFIDPTSFKGVEVAHGGKQLYTLNDTFNNYALKLSEAIAEGKGVYFEFQMTEGEIGFCLLVDWANISGDFKVTKSGDTVTANRGAIVVDLGDGWYGITLPSSAFNGDGNRDNADTKYINRLYYRWSVTAETVYVDFSTMAIVDVQ